MIEIKFRCWFHGKGDPSVTPWMEFSCKDPAIFWLNIEQCEVCCDIMQYTGIKDIKGIDIYEGDIIKVKDVFIDGKENCEDIGFVWYMAPSWLIKSHSSSGSYEMNDWGCLNQQDCFEVIGNKYENQDLLEGVVNDN